LRRSFVNPNAVRLRLFELRDWGAGTRQAVAAPFSDDANQVEKIDTFYGSIRDQQ
jgi:hypothetical protein